MYNGPRERNRTMIEVEVHTDDLAGLVRRGTTETGADDISDWNWCLPFGRETPRPAG